MSRPERRGLGRERMKICAQVHSDTKGKVRGMGRVLLASELQANVLGFFLLFPTLASTSGTASQMQTRIPSYD